MENKMAEVAKLLGLKLGEEFTIKGVNSSYRFKLTAIGLMSSWRNSSRWICSGLLEDFITGYYQIAKEVNSVLDEAEKRYLSNIIKPFRNTVISIAKYYEESIDNNFIEIEVKQNYCNENQYVSLPYFKKGTMYKGMEEYKKYTLEELGL